MTNSHPSADTPAETPPQKNNEIPKVVYHYTNTAALLSIIQHKKLWATSIRYMNDPLEFSYARDPLLDALKEELEAERQRNNPLRTNRNSPYQRHGRPPFVEYILDQLIQSLSHETSEENHKLINSVSEIPTPFSMYSVSFCKDGDLLSQWRGYAGSDGWALGFDPEAITVEDPTLQIVQVKYGDEERDSGIRNTLQQIINSVKDEFSDPKDLIMQQAIGVFQATNTYPAFVSDDIMWGLTGYKHSAFSEEKEWRIVVDEVGARLDVFGERFMPSSDMGVVPDWSGFPEVAQGGTRLDRSLWRPIKFRPGAVALTPYLEIPFAPKALREVVIGPHPHQELQKVALEQLLRQEDLGHVEICLSEAPFR